MKKTIIGGIAATAVALGIAGATTATPAHADMISVVGDNSYGGGVDYSGISGTEITRVIIGEVVA